MSGTQNTPQWLRKAQVILTNATGASGGGSATYSFDEQFRFTFNTVQRDAKTYNTVRVRLYNLSDQTINALLALGAQNVPNSTTPSDPATAGRTAVGEAGELPALKLILKAGYQPPGNFATIFQGYVTQFTHGRENNINSFLEVYGADGDEANYVVVNQTLAGAVTQQQQANAVLAAMKQQTGIDFSNGQNLFNQSGGVLPRGKVLYGAYGKYFQQLGDNRRETWSILNGKLCRVPLGGYLAGDVVVINSATGLVGTPETTQSGLTLTCLLNPNILLGQRIQLNNKEINQTIVTNPNARSPGEALNFFASESADGIYRVCVHEFDGDTRGTNWYSKLTVLSIDPSAVPTEAVIQGNR